MHSFRCGITLLLLFGPLLATGQYDGFDTFISRLSDQYKIDVAIAPELLPTLDSIRNVGTKITSIEELLQRLLNHSGITYQIIDGNKLMLRRENPIEEFRNLTLLRGIIVDGQTGEPLPFATIMVPGTSSACNSDENGQFLLPVKDTMGVAQINYLGYQRKTIPLKALLTGNTQIHLEIDKVKLEEIIVVVPYKLMSPDYNGQSIDLKGYQFITRDQLLVWNTERLITSLTSYTPYSTEHGIRIRGSDAGNSLLIMDDIPVYNAYHFYNLFSPFNGPYFSAVEIYKNNMPVQYGGRIDGLIHLQSAREVPSSKLILDTDLLQSTATTELVISPEIYVVAGGRFSHTGIINKALNDSSVINFSKPGSFRDENEWSTSQKPASDFYDINLGLFIEPGKNSQLRFHYFESRDVLDNTTVTAFETTTFNHEVISIKQTYTNDEEWKNKGFSAGLETALSPQTSLTFSAFHSRFAKDTKYNSLLEEMRIANSRTNNNFGFQQNELQTNGLKGFIEHDIHAHSGFLMGAEFQKHEVTFIAKENNKTLLHQVLDEKEGSFFAEYYNRIWGKLDGSIGGRMTWLASTDRFYLLPYLKINYDILGQYHIKASFSKNLQAVHKITLENRFGRELNYHILSDPALGYPVLRSDKYMLGAGYSSTHIGLDAEFYYKKLDGLTSVRPLFPDPASGDLVIPSEFYKLFTGNGWTAGMDLMLLYKKKKWDASVLYSLSKMKERYDRIFNGAYFSPQEDRRHQLKVSGTYNVGKFRMSSMLSYKSKAPYLSFILLQGKDGIGTVNKNNVQRFLPAYFSLDLGLDYSFMIFKKPALIGFSIFNLSDHKNIYYLQHLGKVTRDNGNVLFLTNQVELLGRTANVHFRYLLE